MVRSTGTTLLLVLALAACCSAYLAHDTRESAEVATTQQEGRRFGWVINWLNDRGALGQMFANLIVAIFVLPPLGPFVCSFLENCDSLKIRARSFLRNLADTLPPEDRRSRSVQDEMTDVLERIDAAYDKYA